MEENDKPIKWTLGRGIAVAAAIGCATYWAITAPQILGWGWLIFIAFCLT